MRLMPIALFISSAVITTPRLSFSFLRSSSTKLVYPNTKSTNSTVTTVFRMSSSSSSSVIPSLRKTPTISLRNAMEHPTIGFGTYKVGYIPPSASSAATSTVERTAEEIITDALSVGYRMFECAEYYGNEDKIGHAFKASGIPRENLFLCSKVWTTTIEKGPKAIEEQLDKTLKDLQTDYVDLYLIHWPVPNHHVEAYKTLQKLQQQGKIKGIGVSNYAWEDYLELKNDPEITQLPLVNQIEINPFLYRKNTITKFEDEGVVLQSYRALRDGKAMDHPTLIGIAKSNNKTPAQILGKWCIQKGIIYIPKSSKKERMIENAQVYDFELSENDMNKLDELTTQDAIDKFVDLYRKCVNRDTSKDGTMDGVKMDITVD